MHRRRCLYLLAMVRSQAQEDYLLVDQDTFSWVSTSFDGQSGERHHQSSRQRA
jgi:hypothetical protein